MSLENFNRLKVADIRRETADSVSIQFEAPAELAELYGFRAGQYLTLRKDVGGEDLRRNYSVCVSPLDNELRIAIKQIEGGRFSSWVNEHLKIGDEIEVMAPQGRFVWDFDASQQRSYVGLAAGSGITPVLSILKTALATEPKSQFTLFYANRGTASIMFLEELAGLKNRYLGRLQVYHFLEDEEEDVELFNGRLDADRAGMALDQLIDVSALDAAFICGPGPMMDSAEAALKARGVPEERILIERFATGPISAEQAAFQAGLAKKAEGAKVQVTLEGRRVNVAFDPAKGAILDNVRAAGLPAPYACKGGVCATCRAKLVSGTVEMKVNYGLTAEEVADGYILTCQSIPTSRDVVVDYDV
jgi:ring-1,2-phenylacetyl-CoA epoxidase subunit PaaE